MGSFETRGDCPTLYTEEQRTAEEQGRDAYRAGVMPEECGEVCHYADIPRYAYLHRAWFRGYEEERAKGAAVEPGEAIDG